MLRYKTLILSLVLFLVSINTGIIFAQSATVRATIQPAEIVIGQQAILNLEVIAPKNHQITFPAYKDTLVNGIEVLQALKADTTYAHDVMTINQKYVVTSFDSALYHVSYIPVLDNEDTIKSNDFGLKVTSPMLTEQTLSYLDKLKNQQVDSIDFDQLGIYDIKTVQEPPFVWTDYLLYILLLFLLLPLSAAIVLGIFFYKKKKVKGYFFKPEEIKSPHVIAIDALNHVKDEKLWQYGKDKEYYTEITDILRQYIQSRFYINAFEMTSDEIISIIKGFDISDSSSNSLTQVLKLADLVKFAKLKPESSENDLSLINAYLFVNQTKKEEAPQIIEEKENKPAEDGKDDQPINWKIQSNEDKFNNTNN